MCRLGAWRQQSTDTIVGRMKPGGSDGLYVIVVATMPESGLGTDGVIVCGVVKGGMASGINSGCAGEAILNLIFRKGQAR